MFRLAALLGLFGLISATVIIGWNGYGQVLVALNVAGWGIVWTSLYHVVPMIFCIIGWRALLPERKKPGYPFFLYVLWLRTSVNNLMPVARIGGEIIAVRVMIKHGIRKTSAIAGIVVEITLSVIAVFFFDAIGIGMFTYHLGASSTVLKLAGGLLLSMPVIAGLVVIQRVGFFGLLTKLFTAMFREKWKKFAGNTARLDRAVHTMYRRRRRVIFCGFWQFISWISGTGEVWLALHFLGDNFSFAKAMMIEALIQATGSVSFTVPGALGVQEASIVFFGQMLGLSPEIAAALAVIRRCRDIILFVPGLIAWQAQEGHWLLKRQKT